MKQARGHIRVCEQKEGTFHPKIIVGYEGKERRAILGSGNMTYGAFGDNTEINVEIEGKQTDHFFQDIDAALEIHWDNGTRPSSSVLDDIESSWKERRKPTPTVLRTGRADILNMMWSEYYNELSRAHQRDDRLELRGPLGELHRARTAFTGAVSFAKMDPEDRKFVAGFAGGAGWFGRLAGNGIFKHYVNETPKKIGKFIDIIPLRDERDERDEVDEDDILKSFEIAYQIEKVRIGTITRLLCVKRPDFFFSVNKANKRLMRQRIGRPPVDAESYLAMLRAVHASPWFNAERPKDPRERRVWNARVALLDLLLYEPREE